MQAIDIQIATELGGVVFSGRFFVPSDNVFNVASATASFITNVPKISIVLDSQKEVVDYINSLLLEDGSVLCCEDGSLITWPWPDST